MKNIMIVEDQKMILSLLEMYIKSNPEYQVVSKIQDAKQALSSLYHVKVDLILMDVMTQNGSSGLDATKDIKKLFPNIKVIIVTSMVDDFVLSKAKEVGADSLWYKDISQEELITVIDKTISGESLFPEAVPQVFVGEATNYDFTKQEKEILRYLIKGYTYQQIADEIFVKVETVKFHVKNMLNKTGCSDKLELAIEVVKSKCIAPDA